MFDQGQLDDSLTRRVAQTGLERVADETARASVEE
jgi:hypothetical protein